MKHPAWSVSNRRKLIATSTRGLESLNSALQKQIPSKNGDTDDVNQWLKTNNVTIKSFEDTSNPSHVDFGALMVFLKSQWNINFADVSAGPTLISLMMKAYVIASGLFFSI